MKQDSIEKYVSLMEIDTSKESFATDYENNKALLTSLLDDSNWDGGGNRWYEIDQKWEERWNLCWKETFKLEYNKALLAFEGAECPLDAYILYCCYTKVPVFLLRQDGDFYGYGWENIDEEVTMPRLKKRYQVNQKNALSYFCQLLPSAYDDYWNRREAGENKGVIDTCLEFKYEELKKIFVETMIELCDLIQKRYSQYLPESFLTARAKDKEFLLLVQKSLQD